MNDFCVRHLSAGYGHRLILNDVSFSVQKGCLMGVLGANGSGKTTLLKSICGILPHEGSCSLLGTCLDRLCARELARLCSYIPQRSGISIDLSVLDVVLMGFNARLGLLEQPSADMRLQAQEALSLVGLAGQEEENYLHLSEGQKQLCILARTLVSGSSLLLLDEPESALDVRCRHKMLRIIGKWLAAGERCAVVALHDPSLALNFCDHLLLIDDGKTLGVLHPKQDSLHDMETRLSRLYGAVTLRICEDKTGAKHIVMLKDEEE